MTFLRRQSDSCIAVYRETELAFELKMQDFHSSSENTSSYLY